MNDLDFQKVYEEQNRRDYIRNAMMGTAMSIPCNLFCAIMDHFMYPERMAIFFRARVFSFVVIALVLIWFKSPWGRSHRRWFGITWFMSPLIMILWMIYAA